MQVEQERLRLQEHLVVRAAENPGNISRNFNPLQFEVGGVASDLLSDFSDRVSFSFSEDDLRLFLLNRLVDDIFGLLCVLLSDLLPLNSLLIDL